MNVDDDIRQEDTWDVIRKYFDENGLVQQQRASYEEFIIQNIQEVVDDYKGQIEVVATNQYLPGQQQNKGRMKLQVFLLSLKKRKINPFQATLIHIAAISRLNLSGSKSRGQKSPRSMERRTSFCRIWLDYARQHMRVQYSSTSSEPLRIQSDRILLRSLVSSK